MEPFRKKEVVEEEEEEELRMSRFDIRFDIRMRPVKLIEDLK